MKKFILLAIAGWLLVPALALGEIVTVFSDQGVPNTPKGFNPINTFAGQNATVQFSTFPVLQTPPEGYSSFQTVLQSPTFAGWAIVFQSPQNLSRFQSGEYRFWIYSSTGAIQIQLKDGGGNLLMSTTLSQLGWLPALNQNQWVLVRIPMSAVNLSSVKNPGIFTAQNGPATFFVDNVHFINSTTAPNFNPSIVNISNSLPATQVTWSNATPSAWTLADQYLSLEIDATTTTWGVQVYTDNTSANANPRFTGVISSTTPTPAGLVDQSDPTTTLPLAWATRSNISTITVVAADPNNTADPNSFQWSFFEDKAQVAVPISSAAAFTNGDPYIMVRNNVGIHYAQGGAVNDPNHFGAEDPPMRIYLETNLGAALVNKTYQTNQLIVELFYL